MKVHPLDIPFEVFVADFGRRIRNALNAEMGYFFHSGDEYMRPPHTVRHFLMLSRKELHRIPNLGKKSFAEIEDKLRNLGLQLWDEHDERSLKLLREHPLYFNQREHVTDGSQCWCSPEMTYKDPENGAEVWVHKEQQ